ncbi:MAG: hypothetical protein HYR84_15675 [Planctomycetes bacterium]|nr:hypothetical protein [Planctomycetota bacterium]
MPYPTDEAGRQQLADELAARGLKPTQAKKNFKRAKLDKMIEAMITGSFDWGMASLRPVVIGLDGEILGGHHRIIAAHLAGIDLTTVPGPRPQIQTVPHCFRVVYSWIDVLPEVQ